ncbi:MAG: 30S ribosome-binding factor RbfA [Streptococcaceae bacterium]|jgi:ribosome-binding factor A|nr:30S ribosome-binding factor RbfA [Streptococcaceae bacterium]
MANQHRVDRVALEIQREVAAILRHDVGDPRVDAVNVTDVQVTGDLGQATIYYSLLSDLASDAKKAQAGLDRATGLVRRELAHRLTMFKVPEIKFAKDESIAYGDKIDALLRQLQKDE